MARGKDESKRRGILGAAKRLFAARGFHGTSMTDLARETGLPVGSIYTYFRNKDAILSAVIEEGWSEFFEGLSRSLEGSPGPEEKIELVVDRVLPELFKDIDLITILLGEAGRGDAGGMAFGLEEKLEGLASLISGIIVSLAEERGLVIDFPPRRAMAAICLYFLGALYTVRLSRSAGLKVGEDEILDFIRLSIENSFGSSSRGR